MNENTKRFLRNQLMWIGIYFGIALVVSFFIPFPYSFIVLIAIVMSLALYRRRRFSRQMDGASGSFFGGGLFGQKAVNYYCINCGTKHNQIACPNCGSKLKKAGF
jgi:cobalamin synthase